MEKNTKIYIDNSNTTATDVEEKMNNLITLINQRNIEGDDWCPELLLLRLISQQMLLEYGIADLIRSAQIEGRESGLKREGCQQRQSPHGNTHPKTS